MRVKLIFLLLFASTYSFAQQKFIEVIVSDTVLARADFFVYSFYPEADIRDANDVESDYNAYQLKLEKRRKATKKSFDSLANVLKARGFVFLIPPAADSLKVSGVANENPGGGVILHSTDSLLQLYQVIRKCHNMIGTLVIEKASDESGWQNKLYKKIVDIANKKAKNLAALANQHLGNIISVSENKLEEKNEQGWTSYPPLSALMDRTPDWHATLNSADKAVIITDPAFANYYPIRASLTIRFSLE